MNIKIGNIWNSKDNIILVTTNSYIKNSGELVMGRGAALEMKTRYPNLPYLFGQKIIEKCGKLGEYGIIYDDNINPHFGIFQVKYHFKDKAQLNLIQMSTGFLYANALQHPELNFSLNFPGIGFGQLLEKDVLPILKFLPDNVTIYKFK